MSALTFERQKQGSGHCVGNGTTNCLKFLQFFNQYDGMTILSLLMLMLIFINCHRTYLLTHSFTQFLSVLSIGNFTERNKELENGLSIQNFGKSI